MWTFSGGLVGKAATLVSTLAAARSLERLQFGEYVGLIAASGLAAGLWDLGVSALVTVEFATGHLSTADAIGRVLKLRSRTAIIWLLVLVGGISTIDRSRGIPALAITVFAIMSLFSSTSMIALAMLRARLQFRQSALSTVAGRWLTAALSVLALPIVGLAGGLTYFALCSLSGEVLTLVLAILAFVRVERVRPSAGDGDTAPEEAITLNRALPYAANGLLALLYNRLDVLIVGGLASVEQLSLYAIASRLQDALYIIPSSLESVGFPVMSNVFASSDGVAGVRDLVRRFVTLGLVVALPVTAVAYITMPQLLLYGLGSQYVPALAACRVLIWFLPISCLCAPMLTALAASGHAVETTKVFSIAAIAALTMHVVMDSRFGALGGAVASLSREPAALAATLILISRTSLLSGEEHVEKGIVIHDYEKIL